MPWPAMLVGVGMIFGVSERIISAEVGFTVTIVATVANTVWSIWRENRR